MNKEKIRTEIIKRLKDSGTLNYYKRQISKKECWYKGV